MAERPQPGPFQVTAYRCRCGHAWVPRKLNKEQTRPRVCPKCKSPYWDSPFQEEESSAASG